MGQRSTSSKEGVEASSPAADVDTDDDVMNSTPADDEGEATASIPAPKEEVDDDSKEKETTEVGNSNDTNDKKEGHGETQQVDTVKDEALQEDTEEKKEEEADSPADTAAEGHNQNIEETKPDEEGDATDMASDEPTSKAAAEEAADTKDSNVSNVKKENHEAEGAVKKEELEGTDKKAMDKDATTNQPETAADLSRDPSNIPPGSIHPHVAAMQYGAAFGGYYGHHMYPAPPYGMYPPPAYPSYPGYPPYPPPHLHHPHAAAGLQLPPEYIPPEAGSRGSPTRAGRYPYAAHHHPSYPPASPVVSPKEGASSKTARPPSQDDTEQDSEEGENGNNKNPTNLKVYYKTTQSVSKEVTDRRSRKNSQSRSRAAKFRERIAEIERKPEEQRTDEERGIYDLHLERKKRKNDRSRERALEKKEEIDRILAKPEKKRTRIEVNFLQNALGAKKRKNEGDRLRRQRMKELGFARPGTEATGKPGISARGPLPPQYEHRLTQWHQGYGEAPPMMHPPPYYHPEHVPRPHPGSPGGPTHSP